MCSDGRASDVRLSHRPCEGTGHPTRGAASRLAQRSRRACRERVCAARIPGAHRRSGIGDNGGVRRVPDEPHATTARPADDETSEQVGELVALATARAFTRRDGGAGAGHEISVNNPREIADDPLAGLLAVAAATNPRLKVTFDRRGLQDVADVAVLPSDARGLPMVERSPQGSTLRSFRVFMMVRAPTAAAANP